MWALIVIGGLAVFMFAAGGSGNNADPESGSTDASGQMVYVDPPVSSGPSTRGDLSAPNLRAFLALIRASEGTAQYTDPWGTYYGGAQFSDKWGHPCEVRADGTRLMQPVVLGNNFTTAAGAYQITLGTWNRYGGTAHYGDFSNEAQDQCAADIIVNCGGLDAIAAGDATTAQQKLAGQWASFTPSRLASNNQVFAANGGVA